MRTAVGRNVRTCGRRRSARMPITFRNLQLMNEVIKIAVAETDYIRQRCINAASYRARFARDAAL